MFLWKISKIILNYHQIPSLPVPLVVFKICEKKVKVLTTMLIYPWTLRVRTCQVTWLGDFSTSQNSLLAISRDCRRISRSISNVLPLGTRFNSMTYACLKINERCWKQSVTHVCIWLPLCYYSYDTTIPPLPLSRKKTDWLVGWLTDWLILSS